MLTLLLARALIGRALFETDYLLKYFQDTWAMDVKRQYLHAIRILKFFPGFVHGGNKFRFVIDWIKK